MHPTDGNPLRAALDDQLDLGYGFDEPKALGRLVVASNPAQASRPGSALAKPALPPTAPKAASSIAPAAVRIVPKGPAVATVPPRPGR